jgi:hypothetical protein
MLEDLKTKNQVKPLSGLESQEVAPQISRPAHDRNAVAINRHPRVYPVDTLEKSSISCAYVEGRHSIGCILLRELSGDLIVSIVLA